MTRDTPSNVRRILHIIHALWDIKAARERYFDVLAAIAFGERVHVGEDRDMTLLYVADCMLELMAPLRADAVDKSFARYLGGYGEGYHSLELQVDDLAHARLRCDHLGFTLSTVYDDFFFVDPRSSGGVIVEAIGRPMRNDPALYAGWEPDWLRGQASTLRRIRSIVIVPRDLTLVLRLLTEAFDGVVLADQLVEFPQPARRTTLRLGDKTLLILSPLAGDGPLTDYLSRRVSGLYALLWEVEDLAAAQKVFAELGVDRVSPAVVAEGFALSPATMFGAHHEFVQCSSDCDPLDRRTVRATQAAPCKDVV